MGVDKEITDLDSHLSCRSAAHPRCHDSSISGSMQTLDPAVEWANSSAATSFVNLSPWSVVILRVMTTALRKEVEQILWKR